MTAPELSVADVLRKAVDVLAERGWHQGAIEGPNGERCAFGAIREVLKSTTVEAADHHSALFFEVWLKDNEGLALHLGIGAWNDDPARSYEDVVLALKLAAADADLAGRVVAPPNAHTETAG